MKPQLPLIAILLLAAFLRFYHLSQMPALNADEAALGYNAYSILKTGRDEYGQFLPLVFKSFGDYKPGLYVYLTIPFVAILGLTELAVRLPSALAGVASIYLIYLLTQELFPVPRSKRKSHLSQSGKATSPHPPPTPKPQLLPLLTALLLAISPWHLHFSRGGWEANLATFFLLLGAYLFLKWKNLSRATGQIPHILLLFSVSCFLFSLYSYHSMRLIAPLLGITLAVIFKDHLLRHSRWVLASATIAAILLIPFILLLLSSAGTSRFSGVSIFADSGPFWRVNQLRGEHSNFTGPEAKILHNKPLAYGLSFAENYLDHFWGEFLFLSGDEIQRNKVPETGLLYIFQLPLLLVGLYHLLQQPITKNRQLLLIWTLLAPIPAALTFQSPHALRAHNLIIPLTIISALGLTAIINSLQSKFTPTQSKSPITPKLLALYLLLFPLPLWEFSRYLHQYYAHLAQTYPFSSQYGFKQLASWIKNHYPKYPEFVVTDRYDQPYILTLFYLKYPPEQFQIQARLTPRDRFGFSTVRHFDKFYFQPIDFAQTRQEYPQAVIIGTPEEIPPHNTTRQISFPSGDPAFLIATP